MWPRRSENRSIYAGLHTSVFEQGHFGAAEDVHFGHDAWLLGQPRSAVEAISMIARKGNARLLVIVVLACLFGCEDKERFDSTDASAILIAGIASYQSVDEFISSLNGAYSWEALSGEDGGFSGDRYRPPFIVRSILVHDFAHLGHQGSLLVIFFNDRLAKTFFFPSDRDAYLLSLSVHLDIEPDSGKGTLLEPRVRLWTGIDGHGNAYVAWQDERLAEEMDRWISENA